MATVNQYRVRCTTDSTWEYVWSETEPTVCPTNAAHSIDANLTTIVLVASTEQVNILSEDGTVASFPQTSSKTPIYQPNIIPPGYLFYGTSAFDDISAGTRGNGEQIALEKTDTGESFIEGRFLEHVYVLGGAIGSLTPAFDDWVSLEVYAPASVAAANGGGTGNANKIPITGGNLIVPAAGDGAWDIDGAVFEAGEINQDLCPIPSYDEVSKVGTGYWNWDPALAPAATITPAAGGDGNYNLIDFISTLARQANRISLLIGGDLVPDTIKGKKIPPHWYWKFTLHRASQAGSCAVGALIRTARKKTN